MDIDLFRQLAFESFNLHTQSAEALEAKDGSVSEEDLILYIHNMSVATAIAEIAKIVTLATETEMVSRQGVTLQ